MSRRLQDSLAALDRKERVLSLFAVILDGLEAPKVLSNDPFINPKTLDLTRALLDLDYQSRLALVGTLLRRYNEFNE